MLNNKDKYCVKQMCRVLKVSESGYYRWLKNKSKPTARELLSVEIQAILDEHPDNDNYGVRRINMALEQKGIRVSRRKWGFCTEEGLRAAQQRLQQRFRTAKIS